jgi:hypothetical protein
VSGRHIDVPALARACRCGSGAIPYLEDESPSCAKCGHALEQVAVEPEVGASIRVEDLAGCPLPGPCLEPTARPHRVGAGRPPAGARDAPASLVSQADAGPLPAARDEELVLALWLGQPGEPEW